MLLKRFLTRYGGISLALAGILAGLGCHRADVQQSLAKQVRSTPGSAPKVLAVYEPWFGDPDHINVGYSSRDRVTVQRQIEQAQSQGISGFVVDWYGTHKPTLDSAYNLMQQTAAEVGFKVALMYDEPSDDPDATTAAISAMDYAYQHYISRYAPARAAYLTYQDRPVVFVWPRNHNTDWNLIRQHVNGWEQPPLLIMEDGTNDTRNFDGFYAWVRPGAGGWSNDGHNWGRDYLEGFYRRMTTKYPDKIAVGAAWPGFDDRKASWSENRFMDARCGRTFEESLSLFRRYYTNDNPLPFLLVETWNDYEEGTAIERGINTCRSSPKDTKVGGAD